MTDAVLGLGDYAFRKVSIFQDIERVGHGRGHNLFTARGEEGAVDTFAGILPCNWIRYLRGCLVHFANIPKFDSGIQSCCCHGEAIGM